MTEENKKLRSMIGVGLLFSFTFLTFMTGLSLAKGNFGEDNSNPGINEKIETVEKQIEKERYRLRLNEAKEYMARGDRYYSQGKLQESQVEWYSALALLGLLQDTDIQSINENCAQLQTELKARINNGEGEMDPRRQAQIEKKVKEVLRQQLVAEETAQKQRDLKLSSKPQKGAGEVAATKEGQVSLEQLKLMEANRQAVEQTISQELVKNRGNVAARTKVQATPETGSELQKEMEAGIAKEFAANNKKAETSKAIELPAASSKEQERQKQLEAKRIIAEEETARERDVQLAKQNEDFRSQAEASILKERAGSNKDAAKAKPGAGAQQLSSLEKERKAGQEFRKQAEEKISKQMSDEAREAQELKAKTQSIEADRLKLLAQDKTRLAKIERQLKTLEVKTEKPKAKKIIAKKEKKAGKSSLKESGQVLAPAEEQDKFDVIYRVLKNYDDSQRGY